VDLTTLRDRDTAVALAAFTCRPLLYISGPMLGVPGPENPGAYINVQRGLVAMQRAWRAGWLPFCPMLNSLAEMCFGPLQPGADDGANGWLDYDFAWVASCHAVARLPGESNGAHRELQVADDLGLVVFYPAELSDGTVVMPSPAEVGLEPAFGEPGMFNVRVRF
jgi:hypothetical protein